MNLVIHELGHAFLNRGKIAIPGQGNVSKFDNTFANYQLYTPGFPNVPNGADDSYKFGFHGGHWVWQQGSSGASGEEFSDQFIGWAWNKWEMDPLTGELANDGRMRQTFMDDYMPVFYALAIRYDK
jgi:hypothetical protein